MKLNTMEPLEALAEGNSLPFALIRSLSAETMGRTPAEIRLEELLEASFFSKDQEIRIFRQGGELRAVALKDDGNGMFLDRDYEIANPAFGTRVTVRTYMEFDEDGQAYWKHFRLMDWKGGGVNA